MIRRHKIHKAFTIIETLVAVAIMMIAIAGPLVVANKSLTAALFARNQVAATNLAVEGLEMIRNLKDNMMYSDQIDPTTGYKSLFINGYLDGTRNEEPLSTKCLGPGNSGSGGASPSAGAAGTGGATPTLGGAFNYCGIFLNNNSTTNYPRVDRCESLKNCDLYEKDNSSDLSFYTLSDNSGFQPTGYKRYFYVTPISAGNDTEYEVTVVVAWLQGRVVYTVSISTDMTATII